MLNLEIYVIDGSGNYQRLDLYDDETIELVDSIQNVREPDKAFSGFTKNFSVPASKTNNKIFKHYYNADVNGGFDARVKAEATIKINGIDFRTGRLKLQDVRLVDGKANSYSLAFYDSLTDIKEIIESTKLDALVSLNDYSHAYTGDNVKDGFEIGLDITAGTPAKAANADAADIVYPFISHTKQYVYDNTRAGVGSSAPKLYNILDDTEALDYTQLKPGIKLDLILDAINLDILPDGVVFDKTGFFGTDEWNQLYLWLHRDKGGIRQIESNETNLSISDFTYDSGDGNIFSGGFYPDFGSDITLTLDVDITGSDTYDVLVTLPSYDNHVLIYEQNVSTDETFTGTFPAALPDLRWFPVIRIITGGSITAIEGGSNTTTTLSIRYKSGAFPFATTTHDYYLTSTVTPNSNVDITANVPDMTILDFMTSLFKMFNLTIYRTGDTYYVETLDSYYTGGATRDITEYVDPSDQVTMPPAPYRKLTFEFEEAGSYLLTKRRELLNDVYGRDSYNVGVFDGGEYKIKVGFEKMLWERMANLGVAGDITPIQYAWCVDDDEDPYIGKPIIFAYDQRNGLGATYPIAWDYDSSTIAWQARCSNTVNDGADWQLNFKPEIDEYTLTSAGAGSLFSEFYENYISGLFSGTARRIQISATLPVSFLLNYNLGDTIVYKNKEYFINELTVDLTTGKAELELITKWL